MRRSARLSVIIPLAVLPLVAACGGAKVPAEARRPPSELTASTPVELTEEPPVGEGSSTLTVKNVSSRTVAFFCYSGRYPYDGQHYHRYECCDEVIAAGMTATVPVGETSDVYVVLESARLEKVKFEDGTRWYRRGQAKAPDDGAPLALVATEDRERDGARVYDAQNVGTTSICSYAVSCASESGDRAHTTVSLCPHTGDPGMEAGEVYLFTDTSSDCRLVDVGFADGTRWTRAE